MVKTRGRRVATALLGSVAVVVTLAGAALWWVVLRDDTPAQAALVERTVVATEPATEHQLDGTWSVVPADDVWAGYRITEHVGAIDNVAVARTDDVDASLTIAGTEVTKVTAVVNMASLKSQDSELPGVGARDQAMRGAGLQTDLHPTATFTLTEPIHVGALPQPGAEVVAQAVGTLDLHGVVRPVTIPIRARWNGKVIDLTGSVDVTLLDYGVEPPAPKVVTLAKTGTVEFQLTFARS